MDSLYLAPFAKSAGATLLSIYFLEMLKERYPKVAYFVPIVGNKKDIDFIKKLYALKIDENESFLYTKEEALKILAENETAFLEKVVERFLKLKKEYDFVLVRGISQEELNLLGEDINLKIAKNIATPVVSLLNRVNEDEIDINYHTLIESKNIHLATIVNRSDKKFKKDYSIFSIPEIPQLGYLTINQIKDELNLKVLCKGSVNQRVKDIKVADMDLEQFLLRVQDGDLIVSDASRIDIIFSANAMLSSKRLAAVSAIVLTNGEIAKNIKNIISSYENRVPILIANGDSMQIIMALNSIKANIIYLDKTAIFNILAKIEKYIPKDFFFNKLKSANKNTLTPLMFEYKIFERAKREKKKIILIEADKRIIKAAEAVLNKEIADILFVGDKEEFLLLARRIGADIQKAEFLEPSKEPQLKATLTEKFYKLRKEKGLSFDRAKEIIDSKLTYFATMLVKEGYADGLVCGATHTSAETIRPALQIIKAKEGVSLVSSLFFICLDTKVLVFADCALNIDPTSQELATIAITTNDTAKKFGIEPIVAMISYSSGDSGSGADVDKVKEATQIVKKLRSDILIDGPMQYDAAIDKEVAKEKMPHSKVAGRATVFIFPDLNTGNTTYKAVQRSANAIAIGPILQGLKKPVNDLSRGCFVEDVINTIAITAIQAQEL